MYYPADLGLVFIMGFITGFVVMLYIAQKLLIEQQKETRQWRKEAIAASQNADWWQTQYGRDAK